MNFQWWFGTYGWLEANNLWKSVVAFWVTLALGAALGLCLRPWRSWKRNRELQEKIADRLDTTTPGGLTELVGALYALVNDTRDGDAPDDNGSDPEGEEKSRGGRGGHAGSIIPKGGSSAGHR